MEEAQRLLGTLPPPVESTHADPPPRVSKVPRSFDSRTQWPGCVTEIRDQKHCGGCWAFATAEVLGDRFCIGSDGKINVSLSVDDLLGCWVNKRYNMGCDGGAPEFVWKQYLSQTGIVSSSCFPFTGSDANGTTPNCTIAGGTCGTAGVPFKKYKSLEGSARVISSYYWAVQQEMLSNGPVSAAFLVYHDFFSYKSGVYKHVNGSLMGRHMVKLVGWGVDNTTQPPQNYWVVANSWGPNWGLQGYFKIALGVDESGIESSMIYGSPDLTGHE